MCVNVQYLNLNSRKFKTDIYFYLLHGKKIKLCWLYLILDAVLSSDFSAFCHILSDFAHSLLSRVSLCCEVAT